MAVRVTRNVVHSAKDPTPEEREDLIEYIRGGDVPRPELIDREIEDKTLREGLEPDQANIAITVLPGERLGQFAVNVQFEGKSGLHEVCLGEQDRLLQECSGWLHEILDGLGCDFAVKIDSVPCPFAEARLRVGRAERVIEVGADVSVQRQGPSRRSVVTRKRKA